MNPCHWAFLNCNKSQYAESERERERGRERTKEKERRKKKRKKERKRRKKEKKERKREGQREREKEREREKGLSDFKSHSLKTAQPANVINLTLPMPASHRHTWGKTDLGMDIQKSTENSQEVVDFVKNTL